MTSAAICVCRHSEDDHRRNGGACLDDACACTIFEDFLARPSGLMRRRLRDARRRPIHQPSREQLTRRHAQQAEKRRSEPELKAFANALREVLGLDPIYASIERRRPPATDRSPEILAAMRALSVAGKPQKQIARELGVSQSHVSRCLRSAA